MIQISFLLTLAFGLSFAAGAPTLDKKSPKYVALGFEVHKTPHNQTVSKRGHSDDLLVKYDGEYVITVYAGSNKNEAQLVLDTGSSDLWVSDTSSGGPYDSSASTTFKSTGQTFQDSYGSGNVAGTWGYDTFALSDGTTVTDLYFGDATQDDGIPYDGILGVGLETLEGSLSTYPNFPVALKNQGYIDKIAYSLYLNSEDATTGTVLFGAVDNAKYSGSLQAFPLSGADDSDDDEARLLITLDSVKINGETTTVNSPINLDSGTTYTYLPQAAYDAFTNYFTSCDTSTDKFVEFTFGSLSIQVPYADLFNSDCELEIVNSGSDEGILGQNFLRHAYVVYDLEAKTISLAQVKYTTDSDISSL